MPAASIDVEMAPAAPWRRSRRSSASANPRRLAGEHVGRLEEQAAALAGPQRRPGREGSRSRVGRADARRPTEAAAARVATSPVTGSSRSKVGISPSPTILAGDQQIDVHSWGAPVDLSVGGCRERLDDGNERTVAACEAAAISAGAGRCRKAVRSRRRTQRPRCGRPR